MVEHPVDVLIMHDTLFDPISKQMNSGSVYLRYRPVSPRAPLAMLSIVVRIRRIRITTLQRSSRYCNLSREWGRGSLYLGIYLSHSCLLPLHRNGRDGGFSFEINFRPKDRTTGVPGRCSMLLLAFADSPEHRWLATRALTRFRSRARDAIQRKMRFAPWPRRCSAALAFAGCSHNVPER